MLCKKYLNTNSIIQILFGADLVWKKVGINTAKIVVMKISAKHKPETLYEGRLRVILQMQVSSHNFEPTTRTATKNKSPNRWQITNILVCFIFASKYSNIQVCIQIKLLSSLWL